MFGAILDHHIGQLVIHVFLDALCGVLLLVGLFTDNLRTHRPLGWECLAHSLGLELNYSLRQQWVMHTACAGPRLSPVFDLHTKQLKAVYVCLYPVLAATNIFVKLTKQVASKLCQHAFVQVFGQVVVKVALVLTRVNLNLEPTNVNLDTLGVFNLNLDVWTFVHLHHRRHT